MNRIQLILLFIFITACEKDEPLLKIYNIRTKGVFICNEGNYMSSNASLSYLDMESNVIYNDIFQNATGYPLGDVAQSMVIIDSTGYVVINNSGKIYTIDINTFEYKGVISGLHSPRYIQVISETKAYVTSLYSKEIAIIDPSHLAITGSVNAGKTTEQIIPWGQYFFVTNWSYNNTVQKIDGRDDKVIAELVVPKQPNSLVVDKYNKLWVSCDGGYEGSAYGEDTAALCRIDATSFSLEEIFTFSSLDDSPTRLSINRSGDTLFYINSTWNGSNASCEGVYMMPVQQLTLPQKPIIASRGRNLYGLGIDPEKSLLYVSDAVDYMQRGWVFRYYTNGSKIDSFKAGIVPAYFCFKTEQGTP